MTTPNPMLGRTGLLGAYTNITCCKNDHLRGRREGGNNQKQMTYDINAAQNAIGITNANS